MAEEQLIHLIDDEPAIRRSVGFMLKTAGYRVKAWPNGREFLRELRHSVPAVVLLDVRMPDLDGLAIQQQLIERGCLYPVIVMTGNGDINVAVQVLKAGAMDFLEKPFDRETVLKVMKAAFAELADRTKQLERRDLARRRIAALTPRELEVFEGLAQGFTNKTVAFDLNISPRTVEVYRANIMHKLNVTSFPDALRIAFSAGLAEIPEVASTLKAVSE